MFLWGPLRHKGIGLIAMMIVTIGLQFFLRNVYAYGVGRDPDESEWELDFLKAKREQFAAGGWGALKQVAINLVRENAFDRMVQMDFSNDRTGSENGINTIEPPADE